MPIEFWGTNQIRAIVGERSEDDRTSIDLRSPFKKLFRYLLPLTVLPLTVLPLVLAELHHQDTRCLTAVAHIMDLQRIYFRDSDLIIWLSCVYIQHALDCKKGGLVIQRHNEIRDCIGDIASQVWTHVIKEPVVREVDVKNADGGLRLDLGIRGVWQPQVEALFDVKVVDTDAPSHRTRSPEAILESGAKEKKRVYEQAVVERRGNFTPSAVSGCITDTSLRFHNIRDAFIKGLWIIPLDSAEKLIELTAEKRNELQKLENTRLSKYNSTPGKEKL
eukprot:Em0021g247a